VDNSIDPDLSAAAQDEAAPAQAAKPILQINSACSATRRAAARRLARACGAQGHRLSAASSSYVLEGQLDV